MKITKYQSFFKRKAVVNIILIFGIITMLFAIAFGLYSKQYWRVLISMIGIVGMLLPRFITSYTKLKIPDLLESVFVFFIYCTLFLGEMKLYYIKFEFWDLGLHLFSGFFITAIGFSLGAILLNKCFEIFIKEHETLKVNKLSNSQKNAKFIPFWFLLLFAFCFTGAVGMVWELCEFTIDNLFGTNCQPSKVVDINTTDTGLIDTVEDFIANSIGSIIFIVLLIFYEKGYVKFIQGFIIKEKNNSIDKLTKV